MIDSAEGNIDKYLPCARVNARLKYRKCRQVSFPSLKSTLRFALRCLVTYVPAGSQGQATAGDSLALGTQTLVLYESTYVLSMRQGMVTGQGACMADDEPGCLSR